MTKRRRENSDDELENSQSQGSQSADESDEMDVDGASEGEESEGENDEMDVEGEERESENSEDEQSDSDDQEQNSESEKELTVTIGEYELTGEAAQLAINFGFPPDRDSPYVSDEDYHDQQNEGYQSDEGNSYEAAKQSLEDSKEKFDKYREALSFIFENRKSAGITQFHSALTYIELYENLPSPSNLEGLIRHMIDENPNQDVFANFALSFTTSEDEVEYAKEKIEESLDDDELMSLDKELVDELGLTEKWTEIAVEVFCKDIRGEKGETSFDDCNSLYNGDIELSGEQKEQIAKAYVDGLENDKVDDLDEAIDYIIEHGSKNTVQDLIDVLLEKVKDGEMTGEEYLAFVEKYNDEYGAEEDLIEESLKELVPILLDKDDSEFALEAYDKLREIDEDNFVNDLRLAEILEEEERSAEAFRLCVKCNSENKKGNTDEKPVTANQNDDTTDAESIKRQNRNYDILSEIKSIPKSEKLVFIAKAIGKSLPFTKEVNQHYYENQKKKLGEAKAQDQNHLEAWVFMTLTKITKASGLKISTEDLETATKTFLSSTHLVRYHRVLSIDNFYNKDSHFEKTPDVVRIHKEDADEISKCLKDLFGDGPNLTRFNTAILLNYGQNVNIDRPTLGEKEQCDLAIENELDLFADIRLIRTSLQREHRNSHGSEFGGTKSEETYRFYFNSNLHKPYSNVNQGRTEGGAITYLVPILKGQESYPGLYKNKIVPLLKLVSNQDLACFVRGMLRGDKTLIKKDGTEFKHKELKYITQTIADITALILAVEGSRNSSTFIINQMMLDLIIDDKNGKMTWQDAFEKRQMPMAMEKAMESSRRSDEIFAKHLPYSFLDRGPKAAKKKKDVASNELMQKEDDIIKRWLEMKGKSGASEEGVIELIHDSIKGWYPKIDGKQLASYPKKFRVVADKKEEKKSDGKDESKADSKAGAKDDKKDKEKKKPQAAALQADDPILEIGNLGMNHVSFLFQNLLQNEVEAGSDVDRSFGRAVIIQNNSSNDDLRTEIENFLVGQAPVNVHGAAALANLNMNLGQERVLLLLNTQDQIPSALAGISAKEDESAKYNHWTVLHLKKDEQGNLVVKYADSIGSHNGHDSIPASVVKCLKEVCAANKRNVKQGKFISTLQTQLNCGYNAVFHALKMLDQEVPETVNEFIAQVKPTLVEQFGGNIENILPSSAATSAQALQVKQQSKSK